ncbi:MAG: threonine synthase [Candidatus Jettenia sp.]|uniref:Threonine synthase n=1 Tax=Candidatus Jettenia caeni TaxID=247490 RepID=I3IIH1_9BACT|nr:threonine synthase [Candidatus Jettenia sp. AMX1]MBC6928246.1 threonine synthase [Candidatus Jettenia sp.]NUN22182.1 threonine synthase [Candidatus Jettenia caeni]KAA0249991.1 MAG: threonine synthase [Candidatus Jettenia sp. AMX1]MCE7880473.1 threonine synthase [Candidatus Jettenia sp. AMX1]MCQ3926281.1 threonine synthase [Candidatus Jettenia sp.]
MPYHAWFQCISGCDEKYELNEIIYQCRKCGDLLEVKHDLSKLRRHSPEHWKKLFDERYRRTKWPYGSSVWGKKEFVCPNVDNENIVSLYEGGSNLFWAERLGKELGVEDLWIKQCGNAHTGSFKDLGMTVLVSMVKQMISEGKSIPAVACASTGDTSAALASYCAAAGILAIVFLPKNKVSHAQLIQPIANGALTLSLDTDFDGCMKLVREICSKNTIYLANSMNSLRIEGQKTVSMEIVQQFDWEVPDVIIVPGGNLGNTAALGKGFLMMKELGLIEKQPRIVCAQAAKANPLYLSYLHGFKEFRPVKAQKTLANAIQIGDPVSYKKAINVLKTFHGIVEQATEDELANASAQADRTGLFSCPHTGVALAVLIKLIKKNEIMRNEKVVVISTAHGLKFPEFKINYHENKLEEVIPRFANLPVEVSPRYDEIMTAIDRKLEKISL